MTRSPYSWLRWWASNCPWELVLPSRGLDSISPLPQRRPPSISNSHADWITVSILLSRLTAGDRYHIRSLLTGMLSRLPRSTERRLTRELKRRRML